MPFVALACSGASAQVIQPPFDAVYSLIDLGSAPGVPTNYGGLTIKDDDPNTLLLGGSANSSTAQIFAVPLTRTCGRISGFAGAATPFAASPNIDGGLAYGPEGVLFFTRYSMNNIGQIKPGSTGMDKTTPLSPIGATSSVGAMQFVPPGFPGAGQLKIASFNASQWHTITIEPDGEGTYDAVSASPGIAIGGGPEGIVFVPAGSPQFPVASVLVCEFSGSRVVAYELDANGDPIVDTRRVFITGLTGAEGGHIDAATGDFLFSTFGGGNRVIAVRGFSAPCPGDTNGDNVVDFGDLSTVLSTFGQTGEGLDGDVNNDCVVDFGDLSVVLSNFGVNCD
ncbi:MAG: hypothetical protein EA379_02785 [Phycisphaerales bacterium]|nr:MAG: hypothetical protein EA379_02785 [Phycisphaerales bacterium]